MGPKKARKPKTKPARPKKTVPFKSARAATSLSRYPSRGTPREAVESLAAARPGRGLKAPLLRRRFVPRGPLERKRPGEWAKPPLTVEKDRGLRRHSKKKRGRRKFLRAGSRAKCPSI